MPKICILKFEHRCGGYECDPDVVQDSDWFEVTDEELVYLKSAIRDYTSTIYDHTILIKPKLDIDSLKLKSKEYYEKIIAQEKKKADTRAKKEKEKKDMDAAKVLAKKRKKLEQLRLELGDLAESK